METVNERRTLHGRRKGRPLSPRRVGLMATLYPTLALDLASPAPDDLRTMFKVAVKDVRLEVGFGGGEHLIAEATAAPDTGFIGVEPFEEGMAKAVAAIEEGGIGTVRLSSVDAALVLDWVPPGSLREIDLLYPDPWPKKRHWKRRFVSAENLDRMAQALPPGGLFRFASDIPAYVEWTLFHLQARTDFAWTAETADDWRKPFPGWTGTRYEAKALREGRTPAYLEFRRV